MAPDAHAAKLIKQSICPNRIALLLCKDNIHKVKSRISVACTCISARGQRWRFRRSFYAPTTSKKLSKHIGLGLSVCPSICPSICGFRLHMVKNR